MLLGCIRFLNYNNFRIPEDIAIVTFDDYDFVSALNPPITALERIDLKIGEIAAKLLFERINGKKENFEVIKIDSDLIIRRLVGILNN